MTEKRIHIYYYALLREERGVSDETLMTTLNTAKEVFESLRHKHHLSLSTDLVRVAINNELRAWDTSVVDGDKVIFIPPVAGG